MIFSTRSLSKARPGWRSYLLFSVFVLSACGGGGGGEADGTSSTVDKQELIAAVEAALVEANTADLSLADKSYYPADREAYLSAINAAERVAQSISSQEAIDQAQLELATAKLSFQAGQISHLADLTQLYAGITEAPAVSDSSFVAAYLSKALPVFGHESGQHTVAVARHGEGRIALLGNAVYLDALRKIRDQGASSRFVENLLDWLTARSTLQYSDANTGERMRVLASTQQSIHNSWPFDVRPVTRWRDQSRLLQPANTPLAIIDRDITAADLPILLEYLEAGGALILAQAAEQPDKAKQSPAQQLLAEAGLAWSNASLADNLRAQVPSDRENFLLGNATQGLAILQALQRGEAPAGNRPASAYSEAELMRLQNTLVSNLAQLPLNNGFRRELLLEAQTATAQFPLNVATQPYLSFLLKYYGEALSLTDQLQKHPHADTFPGPVSGSATRLSHSVSFNYRYDEAKYLRMVQPPINRQSTGLYAPAGELITLNVSTPSDHPRALNLRLRIGAHSAELNTEVTLQRPPKVSFTQDLELGMLQITSPFGGLIYLESDDDQRLATVGVAFDGVVFAPWFVAGRDSNADWNNSIKNNPAPWAELASQGMIVTVPTSAARNVNQPSELMAAWQGIIDLNNELANISLGAGTPHTAPALAQRLVVDQQIDATAHAGYPLHIAQGQLPAVLTTDALNRSWEFWHLLGHNYQQTDWLLPDTEEVTGNLFALYVQDQIRGTNRLKQDNRYQQARDLVDRGVDWAEHTQWTKLVMFDQLRQRYGWSLYQELMREYRAISESRRPKNQQEINGLLMETLARLTGEGMLSLFDAYGLEISPAARQRSEDRNRPEPSPAIWLQLAE